MEIGYQSSPGAFATKSVGPWRFCYEDDLREVVHENHVQLACMLDIGRIRLKDLRPAEDSVVSILRVATYAEDIDEAIDLLHGAQQLGYALAFCYSSSIERLTGGLRSRPGEGADHHHEHHADQRRDRDDLDPLTADQHDGPAPHFPGLHQG